MLLGQRTVLDLRSRHERQQGMRITRELIVDDHEIQERFVRSVGTDGQNVLVVTSRRYRSQLRNRQAARGELRQLARDASEPPAGTTA